MMVKTGVDEAEGSAVAGESEDSATCSPRSFATTSSPHAREIVVVLEPDSGRATIECGSISSYAISSGGANGRDVLRESFGASGMAVNCGRPGETLHSVSGSSDARIDEATPSSSSSLAAAAPPLGVDPERLAEGAEKGATREGTDAGYINLYRVYHGSTVDGPGRRSVIQLAGCSIRCEGCYVPETHDPSSGSKSSIADLVREVVSKRNRHDGVTILGGEPFDQADALAALAAELKREGLHVVVYTGYELSALGERIHPKELLSRVLDSVDILIDGPFRRAEAIGAGEYRGSANQKLIQIAGRDVRF